MLEIMRKSKALTNTTWRLLLPLPNRSSIDLVWALYSTTHRNGRLAVSIVLMGLTQEKLCLKFSMKLKNGLPITCMQVLPK